MVLKNCSLHRAQNALRSLGRTTEDTALVHTANLCFLYGHQNNKQLREGLCSSGALTFWRRNYFFNFSTLCV